jgi:hypothetical protein
VTGGWRKLHNEELHNLYSSPNIIRIIKSRRMRWAGHVARMGEKMNVYRLLVGKREGKRSLGRPRRRWIDNIKMDLVEIGLSVVDWIGLHGKGIEEVDTRGMKLLYGEVWRCGEGEAAATMVSGCEGKLQTQQTRCSAVVTTWASEIPFLNHETENYSARNNKSGIEDPNTLW